MLLVSACGGGSSLVEQSATAKAAARTSAVCEGTKNLRLDHAEALIEDGGPKSVTTGERLIRGINAACLD